jgi:hypothetical protein
MTRNSNMDEVTVPSSLLMQLRKVVPKRALTYGESLSVAAQGPGRAGHGHAAGLGGADTEPAP